MCIFVYLAQIKFGAKKLKFYFSIKLWRSITLYLRCKSERFKNQNQKCFHVIDNIPQKTHSKFSLIRHKKLTMSKFSYKSCTDLVNRKCFKSKIKFWNMTWNVLS